MCLTFKKISMAQKIQMKDLEMDDVLMIISEAKETSIVHFFNRKLNTKMFYYGFIKIKKTYELQTDMLTCTFLFCRSCSPHCT